MKKSVEENILSLEASTPEELKDIITELSKTEKLKSRFVSLAIRGVEVLVNPFNMANTSVKELKNNLMFEAVEFLSLPVDEIEFDFQILHSDKEKISGFYSCMPKKLLQSYLSILYQAKLIPIKITAHILAGVDSFLQKHDDNGKSFCIFDFYRNSTVYLAVFHNKQCHLLREFTYGSLDEAKKEIIQSLRFASSKSSFKKFDCFYFSGDLNRKDGLITQLGKEFNTTIERGDFTDVKDALGSERNFFSLNLVRDYAFSLSQRKQIFIGANLVLFCCLAALLLLSVRMVKANILTNSLKASYESTDYDYAKNLKNQLEFNERKK